MSAKTQKLEQLHRESQSEIIKRICDSSSFSTTEKLVLIELYRLRTAFGLFWSTVKQVSEKAGCSARHVYRIYQKFSRMGLLRRQKYWKGINHSVSKKHVVLNKLYQILGIDKKCHPTPYSRLQGASFGGFSPVKNNCSARNAVSNWLRNEAIRIAGLLPCSNIPETALRPTKGLFIA